MLRFRYISVFLAICVFGGFLYLHGKQIKRVSGFTTDDAYISFRYAKNLANTGKLHWNVGEKVPTEGYSNFSWVMLASVFEKFGSSVKPMKIISVVSMFALLLLVFFYFWKTVHILPGAAFAVFAFYLTGFHHWGVSGMETAFFCLLIVSGALLFHFLWERSEETPTSLYWWAFLGVLFFLIACTHFEGVLFGGVACLLMLGSLVLKQREGGEWSWKVFFAEKKMKGLLVCLVVFSAFFGVYQIWRLWFYGHLFPNSFYCKAGAGNTYSYDPYSLIRMLAKNGSFFLGLLFLGLRKRCLFSLYSLLLAGAYVLLLWDKDPIIGHWNRHIMGVFFLILFFALRNAWVLLEEMFNSEWKQVVIFGLSLSCFLILYRSVQTPKAKAARSANGYRWRSKARERTGLWLKKHVKKQESVVIGDCGVIPYFFEGLVIDQYCLNNTTFVHQFKKKTKVYVDYLMNKKKPNWMALRVDSHKAPFDMMRLIMGHRHFANYEKVATFGSGVRYNIYRRRSGRLQTDFYYLVEKAKVTFHYSDKKTVTPRFHRGFFRGRRSWEKVGPIVPKAKEGLARCIYVHPIPRPHKIVIRFPKTKLSSKLIIHLGVMAHGRIPKGFRVEGLLGDKQFLLRAPTSRGSWQETSLLTKKGKEESLQLTFYAKKTGKAWTCFQAWTVKGK